MASSFCVFEADAVSDWKRLMVEEHSEVKGKNTGAAEKQSRRARRWVLTDPDAFEESLCQERACVVVDKNARGEFKILKLEKNCGFYLGKEEMKDLVVLAEERWEEWRAVLGTP